MLRQWTRSQRMWSQRMIAAPPVLEAQRQQPPGPQKGRWLTPAQIQTPERSPRRSSRKTPTLTSQLGCRQGRGKNSRKILIKSQRRQFLIKTQRKQYLIKSWVSSPSSKVLVRKGKVKLITRKSVGSSRRLRGLLLGVTRQPQMKSRSRTPRRNRIKSHRKSERIGLGKNSARTRIEKNGMPTFISLRLNKSMNKNFWMTKSTPICAQ